MLLINSIKIVNISSVSSVQSLSHVRLLVTPYIAAHQASLSITNSQSLLKLMSIKSVMPSNHLILSSPSPPDFNLSQNQGFFPVRQFFASGGQSIGNSASSSVLQMNIQESFRMDLLDLFAVQGTIKSLFQHHSSKASILWHSAFFIVQLSYPFMTTGKTIALAGQTFVSKVMSLLFNMLSNWS